MVPKKKIHFIGDPTAKKVMSFYETKLEKSAKTWDTDIVFVLCHGEQSKVPQEMDFDKFYIFIQLLPNIFEGKTRCKLKHLVLNKEKIVFPIKKDSAEGCPQSDSLQFSKAVEDCKVISDDEKTPVAVIYDGSLYILNDFIHCRNTEELEISSKIFDYIIDQAINKTDFLKHLKSGVEEKSKRVLELALKSQFTQRLDKEKVQLKASRDTMTQYEKGIVECQRKILTGEKILEAIVNNLMDVPKALSKTWESIHRMSSSELYEDISFMKTGLKAITTPITLKHNKIEYDMGKYEIKLLFNGTTQINSTGTRLNDVYDHPHINKGNPCWGNMSGTLPKLIGSSEYDVALVMIHTFLKSYDQNNPFYSIDHWPVRKKEEVKK